MYLAAFQLRSKRMISIPIGLFQRLWSPQFVGCPFRVDVKDATESGPSLVERSEIGNR